MNLFVAFTIRKVPTVDPNFEDTKSCTFLSGFVTVRVTLASYILPSQIS